mmetsp:Transcript_36367/g.56499  ORF Transcript_36367/g.56499 Transcript_36367/m.56499 type:complete len:337 (+) Transcript_36367:206-1216(+)
MRRRERRSSRCSRSASAPTSRVVTTVSNSLVASSACRSSSLRVRRTVSHRSFALISSSSPAISTSSARIARSAAPRESEAELTTWAQSWPNLSALSVSRECFASEAPVTTTHVRQSPPSAPASICVSRELAYGTWVLASRRAVMQLLSDSNPRLMLIASTKRSDFTMNPPPPSTRSSSFATPDLSTCSDPPRSARQRELVTSTSFFSWSKRSKSSECARELRSFISVAALFFAASPRTKTSLSAASSSTSTAQSPACTARCATPCHCPTAAPSLRRSVTASPKISTYVTISVHRTPCRRLRCTACSTSLHARGTIPARSSDPSTAAPETASGPNMV